MAIKVKAVERELKIGTYAGQYRYVMQADLYNKLSAQKVIQEAALRSGISKGAINAAWDAIGEVIKAWATEGHSVAIPGLGTMRFGVRATSVDDVNKVASSLITMRRVIFTPNVEIKDELKRTSINITCYNRNGEIVRRVTSDDNGDVEDNDNPGEDEGEGMKTLTLTAGTGGSVSPAGESEHDAGESVQITATPNSGWEFLKWSDGNMQNPRTIVINEDMTLEAQFQEE